MASPQPYRPLPSCVDPLLQGDAPNAAIPSLPPSSNDRLYLLNGELFVAMPLLRYQALVASQVVSTQTLPLPVSSIPVMNQCPATSPTATGSLPTSPGLFTGPSPGLGAVKGLVNTGAHPRARVLIACTNCHEMRKSCDDARPCRRCLNRGQGATCVDHARVHRRIRGSQSCNPTSSTSDASMDMVEVAGQLSIRLPDVWILMRSVAD
ncbi:hypothetical protein BD311DRAFT_500110 [Dichomitus squalens]|uniref:Transcription activator of gluconeogenesis ERT1 n=1 Tax=Dichomitus squalens TaxID=114155 RepID=A0A4Q9MDM9_9APHY|nr:hypothetical protein BD311DRAFT_500110 [Dichomitus squalens]